MTQPLHFLLLSAALSLAPSVAAQSTAPIFEWGNLLTGKPGQDQNSGIAVSGADTVYWLSTNGSTTDDTDVCYAGEPLYYGSPYDGTGANKNLTLLKTDASGNKEWVIYSKSGDFVSGEGKVAVNSRGDIVVFGAVRATEGQYSEGIHLVDADGNDFTLAEGDEDKTHIRLFLATASADGQLIWAKTYEVSTAPAAAAEGSNATFTPNAVNAYALTIDDDNNIYIGGRYRNPLTFPKADGSDVTLTPKNVSTWNGDSQKACGDMYVVKLDSEGHYMRHLEESGDEVNLTYTWDLKYADGAVYMAGYAQNDGEGSVEIGGVSLTPNQYISPIAARLDTDLDIEWIRLYPGGEVAGKNAVQNVGLSVSSNGVWLAGAYNGRISDSDNADKYVESTQGTLREGFILKLAPDNGSWIAAANSRTDFPETFLTCYLRVVTEDETLSDNVLVYGYALNASVGAFIRSYNAETLEADTENSWNIVTQGGAPTAQDIAYAPEIGAAYVSVRGNKAFQPLGGELSEAVTGFTNYLARFDIPMETSGIGSIYADDTEDDAATEWYNLEGLRIAPPSTPGIYLRRHGSDTVKIMVR